MTKEMVASLDHVAGAGSDSDALTARMHCSRYSRARVAAWVAPVSFSRLRQACRNRPDMTPGSDRAKGTQCVQLPSMNRGRSSPAPLWQLLPMMGMTKLTSALWC